MSRRNPKPVEEMTPAELQFDYDDLTRAIHKTSALSGTGPGKAMSTTPQERAHVIRRWQEELHPVVAEMKRRGVEPRVWGAKKSRRNPQEATWLDYDVVSSRCPHDTPLGEVCLECEEEAEYDLESSAPGRWRERDTSRPIRLGARRNPDATDHPDLPLYDEEDLDDMINSYIETALRSSTDDEGEPLDKKFDPNSFTQEDADKMAKDCKDFLDKNHDDIVRFMQVTGEDLISVGHLFWLTRNRHGSGFWEYRPREHLGLKGERAAEKLTEASHAYGEVDLYVGDDGNIYVS